MKVIELFSGTESFSSVARKRGHETFTVDINPTFNPDLVADVGMLTIDDFPYKPDVIWASPPCESFSVAAIGKNWVQIDGNLYPKSEKAQKSLDLLNYLVKLIEDLKPKFFFIENPRAAMRKQDCIQHLNRVTVTYCQYGFPYMKPTDIFTNSNIVLKPPCKSGASCHVSAPRGSRKGVQGVKGAAIRSIIPEELCYDIIKYCEQNIGE